MGIEKYLSLKKELYDLIHIFLDEDEVEYKENNTQESIFDNIKKYFKNFQENEYNLEMKFFLQIINKIAKNHNRTFNFFDKVKLILLYFSNDIKQYLSNREIFDIFKSNKLILLFLFKNKIIHNESYIFDYLKNKKYYNLYFHSEIGYIPTSEELNLINSFNEGEFDEKCNLGENDTYICNLIRNDLIDEFVSYTNRNNISLSSQIKQSIFETNTFLLNNNDTTFIEYAAFFGSIQIFNYLRFSNAQMRPKLWLYAIHSKNPEIIHILEEYQLKSVDYEDCLIESIKCHHNDIADYILNNLMKPVINENTVLAIFDSYNFKYFPNDFNKDYTFFNLCKCNYYKIVNFFIETNEKNIYHDLSKYNDLNFINTDINNTTLLYFKVIFRKENELVYSYKLTNSIAYVVIPPSVTCIGYRAFDNCFSLKQILIPNSVTKIGDFAFRGCLLLKKITIPSVTVIGNGAFSGCSKLPKISIPSSVKKIGEYKGIQLGNYT